MNKALKGTQMSFLGGEIPEWSIKGCVDDG